MNKKTAVKLMMVFILVTGMVFIYSSTMARIRKEITADIRIPDAKTFQGTLVLNDWPELVDFAPGVTAEMSRTSNDDTKCLNFTVTNAQKVNDKDKISEVGLLYRIRVYGTGNIPMSVVLVDTANGNKVYAGEKTTGDTGVVFTFMSDGMEHEFKLPANNDGTVSQNAFKLYLGWQERTGETNYDSSDYEREVELLELRVLVEHEEETTDLSDPDYVSGKVKVNGND